MGLGVYKWGQGYWVRVMTSAFALIILAVGCAWLGRSLGTVDIPKRSWAMTVALPAGQPAPAELTPGLRVTLLGESIDPGVRGPEIGTAEFVSFSAASAAPNRVVTVRKLTLNPKADVSQIKSIAPAPGAAAVVTVVGMPRGEAVFQLLYLQAAGITVLVLVGVIGVYWYVGVRPKTVDFLIATDGEMKKVNWSTRKDIIGSTKVVILWCVLLVGGLFLVDLAFSTFFRLIGVLQTK